MNSIPRPFPLLLAWVSCLPVPQARAEAPDTASAFVAEASHDLGVVAQGAEAGFDFAVQNRGTRPLELHDPRTSAEASIARYDVSVAPGATGHVRLSVDTWAITGPAELPLTLATNDPAQPSLALTLKLDVRSLVDLAPRAARYTVVQGEPEGTIGHTLYSTDGADFKVLEARAPWPYLRVRFREARSDERVANKPGRQWRVETTLESNPPVGPLAGIVQLRLDHPRQKELRLPIGGFVRPTFAVTPPDAHFGDVRPGQQAIFVVKNFATAAFAITAATTDVPGVALALTTLEPGRSYRVRMTIAADAAPGDRSGSIRIGTDHPDHPWLELPLTAHVLAPLPASH